MRFTKWAVVFSVLAASATAKAGPCPTVMIVLDKSGSMASTPSGSGTSPTKMDVAKQAIGKLLAAYGDTIPFGFTTFTEAGFSGCDSGIDILVEPKHGTAQEIMQKLAPVMPEDGTNTGQAVKKVAADPNMHDPARPGSYIILITDGEPACGANGLSEPAYTVSEVMAANTKGVQTFAIGFGALSSSAQMAMDQMADAGGVPCTGASCNGHKFYAAESAQALDDAIAAISNTIAGEFGGACDDSCYANGCPNAGQICVNGQCKNDPCATLVNTCAPGDYCYTDGNSVGTCAHACTTPCAAGQVCSTQGTCVVDPCASVTCQSGSVCRNGSCVNDACGTGTNAKTCMTGQLCYQGECIDDPCRYVQCPQGTTCQTGTGACAGTLASQGGTNGGGGRNRGESGCDYAPVGSPSAGALALGLLVLALGLARRRRQP